MQVYQYVIFFLAFWLLVQIVRLIRSLIWQHDLYGFDDYPENYRKNICRNFILISFVFSLVWVKYELALISQQLETLSVATADELTIIDQKFETIQERKKYAD